MLLKVSAQFHENYGFSWIVSDIDPTFTLGDMAAKRQQILRQLEAEGIIYYNKELPLPLFTQRIAVISSATAAGYGDFCNHLDENEHGYVFHTQLFEAVMQGEGVEQSIIDALNKIYASMSSPQPSTLNPPLDPKGRFQSEAEKEPSTLHLQPSTAS